MSFKLKRIANDIKKLEINAKKLKKQFINDYEQEIKKLIVDDSIKKGFSPVRGGKSQYQKYSKSYADAIKAGRVFPKTSIRPVDLTVSGEMLDSFELDRNSKNILFRFTDRLAKYHNDLGAGKSKVIRRMLPKSGERFKTNIEKQILEWLQEALDKIVAKLK